MQSLRRTIRLSLGALGLVLWFPHSAPAQTDHGSRVTGIDVQGMDRSVKPGDDFFAYANGTWLKETEIPPDKSSYGAGGILVDTTDRRVADLIQAMAKTR